MTRIVFPNGNVTTYKINKNIKGAEKYILKSFGRIIFLVFIYQNTNYLFQNSI